MELKARVYVVRRHGGNAVIACGHVEGILTQASGKVIGVRLDSGRLIIAPESMVHATTVEAGTHAAAYLTAREELRTEVMRRNDIARLDHAEATAARLRAKLGVPELTDTRPTLEDF